MRRAVSSLAHKSGEPHLFHASCAAMCLFTPGQNEQTLRPYRKCTLGRDDKTDSPLHGFWRACLYKNSLNIPQTSKVQYIPPTPPHPACISLPPHTSLSALLLSLHVPLRMATSCSLKPSGWCGVPTSKPQRRFLHRDVGQRRTTRTHAHARAQTHSSARS